jgi:hypothetical protein
MKNDKSPNNKEVPKGTKDSKDPKNLIKDSKDGKQK